MFKRTKEPTDLDLALTRAYTQLKQHEVASEEYAKIMKQIAKMEKLKTQEKSKPISKDTLAMIGGNLAGILIVVAYENSHVWTTKALGVAPKIR
jgi:hypothetical protein